MDIFVQLGFVVLVGLAGKNAILIVEFARQLRSEGQPRREATTEACRLRLRPILMTSFAFILGVAPMVIAQGAGAEMRWSLGTAVFCGMLGVTVFGVFLTPVFFYVIEGLGGLSLLRHVSLQWIAGVMMSGALGLIAGLFAREIGFPAEHWAALAGFAAGLAVTAWVQGAQHRRQNSAVPPPSPSEGPDASDSAPSTEARS